MENGVKLGERNGEEDEVLEVRIEEEKAVVASHGLRGSEGDDVFEEAVEAEISSVDSKDRIDSDDWSNRKVVDMGGSMGVNENLENGNEVERFEEAIGVSSSVMSSDEGVGEKAEVRVSEVSSVKDSGDKVVHLVTEKTLLVEEVVAGDVLADVGERLNNNGVVGNGEYESKMVSDIGATIITASSKDEDEVNERSNEVLEKPDDDIVKHVNMDSIHDGVDIDEQEKQIYEGRENQDANEIEGSDIDSTQEVESNGEIVHQDVKNNEVNEICGTRIELENNTTSHGPVLQGDDINEQMGNPKENEKDDLNEENVFSANLDSFVEEKTENPEVDRPLTTSEDSSVKEITKSQDSLSKEAAKASLSSSDSVMKSFGVSEPQPSDANRGVSEEVLDNPEKKSKKNEEAKQSIPSNTGQEMKSTMDNLSSTVQSAAPARPAGLDIDLNEIKGSDVDSQQEVESNGDIVQQDVKNIEVNEIYPEVDRPLITSEGTSVEEITKAPEVKHSPNLEDSLSEAAAKAPLSSSDSVMQGSGVAEPQVTDANKGVSEGVVNKTDKKMEKNEEDNESIPNNRRQENKPTMDSSAAAVRPAAPARPAGLGRAAALLEPALRMMQQPRMNGTVSSQQNQLVEETTNGEAEEFDETREKLQMIRVKFLRLAHRLGQTPHNVVVAQVLYRLGLAEQLRGRNGGRVSAFSFDRASAMAEQLEAAGQEPLDFSCTIMVLGKTGVGKSSTINSIFDEVKCGTDPFQLATKKVQEVVGTVQGIKVRVIDTPGLLPSWSDQQKNEKILHSIKKFIKKTPPDIVLYLDRLDMQSRDFGDMPLLRTITDVFGPSVWFNAIVVLTHAASAPPEGPNGTATSYDTFVTQRSHAVQQAIRQAAGDMRLMNPVSLVENHLACRTNRAGQRVLPNGQIWKPHLLLLSFASKILAEANTLLKLQDSPPGRPFAARTRAPPLPFLLSSLLQSRPQVKLPTEQFDDDDDSLDDDLDESSDSEEESEYDQLPPFRSLTKAQLAKLPRDQRNAYYAEVEYRENLFMKKQLREDKKRRKILKKMQAAAKNLPTDYNGSAEEESNDAASVPVAMPDLSLPASFNSDNPTHRYRCLDSSNQWLVRPVLEPNGWDHDVGYEGINVEKLFVVKEKIPISFSSQLSKDKKDTNLQMELATSVKHGEGKATSLGFDMQSVGKDIAYTLRGDTRFSNYRRNKATAGVSVTILGDVVSGGVKVEDKLIVNKRGQLVVSGGAMFGRGDAAYGGSLEATLRDKDHPMGRFLSTLGLSVMDWHGDLAIGCNSQTQIPIGRYSNLIGRININNRGSGQVSIRLNSSEQLQIALIALIPFARKLLGYSQTTQYG